MGGGLGVDYEGTRSQSDCSVNYGLNEYAGSIIWAIGDACEEHGLPHPTVITESGRARDRAAVLVSNIIGVERSEITEATPPQDDARVRCKACGSHGGEMQAGTRRSLREMAATARWTCMIFTSATLQAPLACRARVGRAALFEHVPWCRNSWTRATVRTVRLSTNAGTYGGQDLCQLLAVPVDAGCWGIDQLFPVLPLEGLNHARNVVRCCWTSPVTPTVPSTTMLTATVSQRPCQCRNTTRRTRQCWASLWWRVSEILGNMHNLFGDTEAVDVFVFLTAAWKWALSGEGDTVADMLEYVQLDPKPC